MKSAKRIPERDEKCRKDSKEEKKEERGFRKMLRRFEFIIMVTWKEFGTSINRRAISLKVDRFHQEFYLDLKSDFIISYLDST